MSKSSQHISIGEELKVLAQKIDEVKRENWSVSDDVIEAYLIGKDKGAEDLMNSVIRYYVEKLNKVQVSVENVYHSLAEQNIVCKKVYLKIKGLDFTSLFVISDVDFHDSEKKRVCYKTAQKEIKSFKDKDMQLTYAFTCSEELNVDTLNLSGYNVTFG